MLLLEVIHLLLNTAAALLGGRAAAQGCTFPWLRIAGHNPLVQLSWALTEWLVKPFRVLLPGRTPDRLAVRDGSAGRLALAFVLLMRLAGIAVPLDWALLLPQVLGLLPALGAVHADGAGLYLRAAQPWSILMRRWPQPSNLLNAARCSRPFRRARLPLIGGFRPVADRVSWCWVADTAVDPGTGARL